MGRQMPQACADRAPGGVDAGDEQQTERAEEVVVAERIAVDARGQQIADEIVAGIIAPLINLRAKIIGHLVGRALRHRVVGNAEFEKIVDPTAKAIAVLRRNAEHVRHQPHGYFLGEIDGGIARGFAHDPVDELAADLARLGRVPLDRLGGEGGQQHRFGALMLGRVRGDGRGAALGRQALAHHHAVGREMLGVVGDRAHVLVARGQVDAHEAVGVRDRTLLPQFVPDRVRVLDPARIEVVEIGGPIGDGRSAAHGRRISTAGARAANGRRWLGVY